MVNISTEEQVDAFEQLLTGHITTDDQLRYYFEIMAPLYSLSAKKGELFHSAKKDIRYNAEASRAGFGPGGLNFLLDACFF